MPSQRGHRDFLPVPPNCADGLPDAPVRWAGHINTGYESLLSSTDHISLWKYRWSARFMTGSTRHYELAKKMLSKGLNIELVIRKRKSKRSVDQNKCLWATYREVASVVEVDNKRFSDQVWHKYFKELFLGFEEVEMPDGSITKRPISTTKISIQ